MLKKFIKINFIVLIIFVLINIAFFEVSAENETDNVNETTSEANQEQEESKEEKKEKTLDSLSTEKEQLEQNINSANGEIEFVQEQLSSELYELEQLNSTILINQQQIEIMKKEKENLSEFIDVTEIELEKTTNEYYTQKDLVEKRLLAMYEMNKTSYLDVLLNSNSISEFISNYYLISEIAKADDRLLKNFSNLKANLEAITKTLAEKKQQLDANEDNMEKTEIMLENMVAIKNTKLEQLSKSEIELHEKISEYQEQILEVEKEIKLLAIASVGSEYIGGIMAWPVPGYTRITSPFGMRTHPITGVYKLHTGVDIGAPMGSTFIAANDGIVIKAEYNGAYGNMVIIDHGGGVTTLYAHGSEILVEVGQSVLRGDPVLLVGSTGYSTGPHAHFEVRTNGVYQNPLDYITSYKSSEEKTNDSEVVQLNGG